MNAISKFAKLLEPGNIGKMTLKNRMIVAPMGTRYCSETGYVTQRVKDYYEARGKGGSGLVITELVCVDAPEGKTNPNQIAIDDDKFIGGLSELANVIHQNGTKATLQLHHAGRHARSSVTGCQPIAPSPIPSPGFEMPRQMSEADISRLVARFASGALRAKTAGFDAVEVHAAHAYMVAQFISPSSNHRKDRYGGNAENRARFLTEILKAIRAEVGKDYPVWCRLNGREVDREDGVTLDDLVITARMAEEAGADAIHVSGLPVGEYETPELLPFAAVVKKAVKIPVIAVGRLSIAAAEDSLEQGKADFIAFGRANIADSEFASKIASGRLNDIRPCIHCFSCFPSNGIICTVNPTVGREKTASPIKADQSKKVAVIGGGPAGMEAATIAAMRGHKVQLYEKQSKLGGQLLLAEIPPHKEEVGDFLRYLVRLVSKARVAIHLGIEVTPEIIVKEAPDVVVLATGVTPFIPDIPGVHLSSVVQANDVLAGKVKVGNKVVIIGGELVGCEVADFLASIGRKVTVVRRGTEFASKVHPSFKELLLSRLSDKKVALTGGIQYKTITADGVTISYKDGKEQTIQADTVILAAGATPNVELLPILKKMAIPVFPIGDCVEPRYIREAVREGYDTGLQL